jgi:predicted  nucleic acid-binding Zn-ribbon protein
MKAEEVAMEHCCTTCVHDKFGCSMKVLHNGRDCIKCGNYIKGYQQAEKDLLENKHEKSWRLDEKLWKDIKDIEEASYQYVYDASNDWFYDIPTWEDVQDAFKAGSEWKENLALTEFT